MKFNKIIISLLLFFATYFLSISLGVRDNSVLDVFNTLIGNNKDKLIYAIINERNIRTIMGFISGAALAASGVLMQVTTRNPISDPSILGVNSGASLVVVIALSFFGISMPYQYIFYAVIGAIISVFLVFCIASYNGGITPIKLVLSGAALNMIYNSLINIILLPNKTIINEFRFWQIGSLGGATLQNILWLLPIFIMCICISFLIIPSLNALSLGDEIAISLGVNVKQIRYISILLGVILCGSITALCGPITFVGLMVPHFVRMIWGGNIKVVLPYSCVFGANLLVLCDILGRVLGGNGEIQVGIITAIIGSPIFVIVARKAKMKSL